MRDLQSSQALAHCRRLLDRSPAAYLLLAPDLTLLGCNPAYEQQVGRLPALRIGKPLFDTFPVANTDQRKRLHVALAWMFRERRRGSTRQLRQPVAYVAAWQDDDQPERFWTITLIPLVDDQGDVMGVASHPTEITELARLRQPEGAAPWLAQGAILPEASQPQAWIRGMREMCEAERSYLHQLFQQAPGFVCVLRGAKHVVQLANDACYRLVGQRHLVGRVLDDCLPELVEQGVKDRLDHVLQTGEPHIGRAIPLAVQREPFGPLETRYLDVVYQPIREVDGDISGIFIQGHDVTEARELALELSYQTAYDPLTGLLNRREFTRRVEALLALDAGADIDAEEVAWLDEAAPPVAIPAVAPAAEAVAVADALRKARPHFLIYLDLDQFKIVNDHCGHGAGDALLRQVADLLRRHVRSTDILARVGGDEFALVLRSCPEYAAERVANQLRQAAGDLVFMWQGRRYGVSLSVGMVAFGVPLGIPFELALSHADAACFLAKEKGRNRVQVYRAGDDEAHRQLHDMDWASRLRDCLADDRVVLYAQRIVGLHGESTASHAWELLARLQEVDGTLVSPAVFMPAAERFGLMPELDRHIIRKAFAQLHALPEHLRDNTRYFINVSGSTLSQEDLAGFVQGLLPQFPHLRPEHICFEVTETAAVSNLTVTAAAMQQLVDQGFRFALDDFGSGMSSFAYLRQLPVQYVKIDGEFVRHILDDPVESAMVEAVAKVAHTMGIQTVAEFVESEGILQRLVELGVDYGQGFALHRPQPLVAAMEGLAGGPGLAQTVAIP